MIIKNGNVFQEDGSFCKKDVYIRDHQIVEAEDIFAGKHFISEITD